MSNAPVEPVVTITATVTRADGTVEHLGVVCSSTDMPTTTWQKLKHYLKGQPNAG